METKPLSITKLKILSLNAKSKNVSLFGKKGNKVQTILFVLLHCSTVDAKQWLPSNSCQAMVAKQWLLCYTMVLLDAVFTYGLCTLVNVSLSCGLLWYPVSCEFLGLLWYPLSRVCLGLLG